MKVTKISINGRQGTMDINITEKQLAMLKDPDRRWKYGHIQDMLPHLSGGEREFLMTGITPEEWAEIFSGPEMCC